MKKCMLRGYEKHAHSDYLPTSIKYNTWYDFVTPFDWQYVKVPKNSRYVLIYDSPFDVKPEYIMRKKTFLTKFLRHTKGNLDEVDLDDFDEQGFRTNYDKKAKTKKGENT